MYKKEKKDFIVGSDLKALQKIKEAENNFKKTWKSYSFEESYFMGLNFLETLNKNENVQIRNFAWIYSR